MKNLKRNIAIVCGGDSSEHDVSLRSAQGLYSFFDKERYNVYYWREGNHEVDFVISKKNSVAAIEVKSNSEATNTGLQEFDKKFHPKTSLVIGRNGLPAEDFFKINPVDLLK